MGVLGSDDLGVVGSVGVPVAVGVAGGAGEQASFAAHVDHDPGRVDHDPAHVADQSGGDRCRWRDRNAVVGFASGLGRSQAGRK